MRGVEWEGPPPAGLPGGAAADLVEEVLDLGGREVRLFSTITTFGTPDDITVEELSIESYYPSDPESAAFLHSLAGPPPDAPGAAQRPSAQPFVRAQFGCAGVFSGSRTAPPPRSSSADTP